MSSVEPRHFGIAVHVEERNGEVFYAEVVPSGYIKWWRRFLPWVGNWWFEVHSDRDSYALEPGGSGGAYTLSGCVRKASTAVQKIAWEQSYE